MLFILVAVTASFASFRLLSILPSIEHPVKREATFIGSSIMMGIYFQSDGGDVTPFSRAFISSEMLSVLISAVVLMILIVTIIIAVFTRRVESSEDKSDYLEDLNDSIIQSATDAIGEVSDFTSFVLV